MKKIILIFVLISILTANNSFQKRNVETFSDVSVIVLRNLIGDLSLVNSQGDIEIRSLIFYDGNDIEHSKSLVNSTEIKAYKKGDTLTIIAVLPINELSEIKMRRRQDSFMNSQKTLYQQKDIIIDANDGIEHFIDFQLAIPESVKVICDMRNVSLVMEDIRFKSILSSGFVSLSGSIAEEGEMVINTEELIANLNDVNGNLSIKSSENANIRANGNLLGSFNCHIANGVVLFDFES